MDHDQARVAEVHSWLRKAAGDIRAGEFELTACPPLTADIVFHAQQAVEKALKGFLAWHDRPFRKTHNLIELGEACAAINPELEPLLRLAAPMTEYAWRFRYPGEEEDPSVSEAEQSFGLAREVFAAILSQLPKETWP